MLKYVGLILTLPLVLFQIYLKYFKYEYYKGKRTLTGKTVIVTGANCGIGYSTALDFASRGAKLILACRDEKKGNAAKQQIEDLTGNPLITVKVLDLASLASVRAFAEDIQSSEDRLDVLVNNAGAGGLAQKTTPDGLELTMQINYFAPVLLTTLLIDLLKKSAPSRIINVSSYAAKYSNLTTKNLNKYEGPYYTYANSKLANILFTKELAKKIDPKIVSVFSIHPGVVKTSVFRRVRGITKYILNCIAEFYFKTPEEGAQTIIYTVLEPNLEEYSGSHFEECCPIATYKTASNGFFARKIWEATDDLLQLKLEEKIQ